MLRKAIVIIGIILFAFGFTVEAQENMKFDSEAKKLKFIRQMLSKEKNIWMMNEQYYPQCKGRMQDLLVGKDLTAVEPDVRADSEDDLRLEKWKQCHNRDLRSNFPDIANKNFFVTLSQLGAPPYRYYHIELDDNPQNGLEDMIYYEYSEDLDSHTGYAWVDINRCEIKTIHIVTSASSNSSPKPHAVYLNTIVYYKGAIWLIDFIEGGSLLLERLDRTAVCHWLFSKLPYPAKKEKIKRRGKQ